MPLKEHADFLTTLCILSKCDWMNFWQTRDIIIVKQVWKCILKVQKSWEYVKKISNVLVVCVTKLDNNLEITSVRSFLDLGNKIWIGKAFITIVFDFKNPCLDFSFFPLVNFEII